MGIRQPLVSQFTNPHGALGWITALTMPLFSDSYCGDLARLLDLQPEDDVLDVACGSGAFLHKRAAHVRHVAGIGRFFVISISHTRKVTLARAIRQQRWKT